MSIDVQHDPKEHKYFALVDGQEGHVVYSESDGTRDFHHTFVPPELRGRGIAEEIVQHALDDTKKQGLRYTATCPFVAGFLKKHPEYREGEAR